MLRRILAIFIARNREFYRDRAGLGWNILMPISVVLVFAFIFSGEPAERLKVGVVTADGTLTESAAPLLQLRHIRFIPFADPEPGMIKVERHQLDLLVDLRPTRPIYWVNTDSPGGYIGERLLHGAYATEIQPGPERRPVSGEALSYADWIVPGILAMNIMFSSLWGVGWVIVRYRKNGVLRRLKATPLSPFEFLTAQILSRLIVVLGASLIVFSGAALLLDVPMRGSYLALASVYTAGALCMISLGLIVAARLRTEELADGILNLLSWPMLLLSGVWFSLDGASPTAQALAQILPLTHLVAAARRIMIDGAGLAQVLPEIALLTGIALGLLIVAARLFRWE